MTFRTLALTSACAMLALGTAAAADPVPGVPDEARNCTLTAYDCGMRAFYDFGAPSGVYWFRRAAREGSVQAMRALGGIYMRGDGEIPRNAAEAMGWFYEASMRDDAEAMYALSQGFARGVGVERDPRLARYWLERAAAGGSADARRALRGAQ